MECWMGIVVSMWVLLNGLCWSHGCVDQEREALLQLKPFFHDINWSESSGSSECCEWDRVECNTTTGRVTKLSLSFVARVTKWHLNVSYFLPFEQLTSLDLSVNYLQGHEGNQGFEILWPRLRKLEVLDLSKNHFNESIISSLSGFASLKSLYLNDNDMGTTSNTNAFESLWKLRNLELLDLSRNHLSNNILSSLRGLSSLKDLNLGENQLSGTINTQDLNNILNLKRLDMHANEITGFESFKGNLEFLDLMGNPLNNSVFASLNGLSHLKSLNLSENQLTGSIHLEELASLSNLEELIISNNSNIEEIMGPEDKTTLNKLKVLGLAFLQTNGKDSVIKSLGSLSTLKTIDLQGNILNETNTFIKELFNLSTLENLFLDESIVHKDFLENHVVAFTSLKVLHLSSCGLKGTLPNRGWCDLKNLKELDLGDNEFEGALPSCMSNMSSLHTLRLTRNQFTGNLASGPIPNLKSIEFLLLGYNHFQVSLKPFANQSSLKNLMADGNELIEEVASYSWTPKLQLEVLSLSHCKPRNSKASSLNFLYHQFNLRHLDLSDSKFGGIFPSWLFENNTKLRQIYLGYNSFVGSFQLPSHPNLNVRVIDVSYNKLGGHIPSNLSFIFPTLSLFNISMNSFQGTIPPSLGDINSLIFLDLSNNQLSGEIEGQFVNTPLYLIKLSNNNFSGRMPHLFDPMLLGFLLLGGNNFVGEIPDLSSFIYLVTLDVSNNSLSGMLPSWIANLSYLRIIALSDNQFEGSIPLEFCRLYKLQFLSLSSNDLSGSIPPCFSELKNLEHLLLSRNKFRGPIPHALINVTGLRNLDLGDNNFSGRIPNWIGNFSNLTILLLPANNLHGDIPIELCHLKQLNILVISSNNLSGPLHACLSNLSLITPSQVSIQYYLMFYNNYLLNFKESTSDFNRIIFPIQETLELATKGNSLSYMGFNLDHMYLIDLSRNRFFGVIPHDFGNLSNLRALILSHNNLSGSIPASFSKLKQLENLDLSYNDLNGQIPPQLTEINTLAVFSVAHNHLSGPIPDFKAQFGTFNESCYEGNPLLCGPPLNNSCEVTHFVPPPPLEEESEDDGFMDMTSFWVTLVVTYTMALFGVALVLYINSSLRHAWFYRIDVCFYTCYYFLLDRFQ